MVTFNTYFDIITINQGLHKKNLLSIIYYLWTSLNVQR